MYKILSTLLGSLFFITASIQGEIVETHTTADVLPYAKKDTLVLFNISDTLYKPSCTLASHLWRQYFAELARNMSIDCVAADRVIHKVSNLVVKRVPKSATEESTALLIRKLQQRRIPVFAITGKSMATPYANNFGEITYRHLVSLGIDFKRTLPCLTLSKLDCPLYGFADGIIFTQKQSKGPAVVAFLQRLPIKCTKVVMVDNSRRGLESVEAALKENGISFIGLRYGRCDDYPNQFNPDLGTIQFLTFLKNGTLLSDEEALEILHHDTFNYEELLKDYIQTECSKSRS